MGLRDIGRQDKKSDRVLRGPGSTSRAFPLTVDFIRDGHSSDQY